jgi:nucleoside 2-deoxyribosyltransferase
MFKMADGKLYAISSSLIPGWPTITRDARIPITRFVMENGTARIPAVVATYNIDEILKRSPIPTKEKAWRLLVEIIRELNGKAGTLRWEISPSTPGYLERLRRIGADMDGELRALLEYLEFAGYVSLGKTLGPIIDIDVGVAGLIQYETESREIESSNAFIAMWFADELLPIYESAIAPAVEAWGYIPVRIDRRQHNNKIDDEIVSEIKRSRFVIADFSCGSDGARGGVYYEAGLAAGLGKPVIFTVRALDLNRVHFDTRQFNHIVWEKPEDLRIGLENRIGATMGQNRST